MAKKFFADVTTQAIAAVFATALIALGLWSWEVTYANIVLPAWNLTTAVFLWFIGYTSVPSWLLLTLLAMSGCFVIAILARLLDLSSVEPTQGKFTEFRMFDFVWRWKWSKGHIVHLTPFCPHCDRMARYALERGYGPLVQLHCESCNLRTNRPGDYVDMKNDVELEIVHLARTGKWKDWVEPHKPTIV